MAFTLTHIRTGEDQLFTIQVLLEKLKPMEREAIRLHHLEGCSYSEVARQLKVPLNSIGPLLSRARRKIQATRTEKPQ